MCLSTSGNYTHLENLVWINGSFLLRRATYTTKTLGKNDAQRSNSINAFTLFRLLI